ncbi:TetR/AcrR family transcriptional regulator [Clostridioides sp. ZZV15-6598]|uniref:TetR/AcrR family transcriptional regulator n=1 Tax=Clostridioides sp. ZZV15-6598 TaxID=2811501 RepID=UPI001D10EAED|nr:TetR/AcrR family transcriptional regulator [Clostridioides sp. ZZV15-6598]
MQIKKEEIKNKIAEVATNEFLKKGYENSSMRTIAKKAHTSIGNMYHYYPNKEELLKFIIMPTINVVEKNLAKHVCLEENKVLTKESALLYLDDLNNFLEKSGFKYFLNKNTIILLKLESTDLIVYKERIINSLRNHLKWHLNIDDFHYSKMIINMLIDCIKYILIEYEDSYEAYLQFSKIFRILCMGLIGQI